MEHGLNFRALECELSFRVLECELSFRVLIVSSFPASKQQVELVLR